MGACKQRWRGIGERVSQLYGSCLGQGQVCFALFQPQLWFSAGPDTLFLFTSVVLGLEPIPNAAPLSQGFHLRIKSTWGVNRLPVKPVGLAAGWTLSQARERLMEPPEGCYKREGRKPQSPSAPAAGGAGGRWSGEGCSQHHQGGQYMAYFQCPFVGFASLEGDPFFRRGFVCKLPPPAWRMQKGHPRAGGAQ